MPSTRSGGIPKRVRNITSLILYKKDANRGTARDHESTAAWIVVAQKDEPRCLGVSPRRFWTAHNRAPTRDPSIIEFRWIARHVTRLCTCLGMYRNRNLAGESIPHPVTVSLVPLSLEIFPATTFTTETGLPNQYSSLTLQTWRHQEPLTSAAMWRSSREQDLAWMVSMPSFENR